MIDVSGSYTLGGKTHRSLASQVEQNKRDIEYLMTQGLLPTGELEITENGEYDVKTKASVSVEVPQGIFPTGTKIITSNGSYDVEEFKNVLINVSGGLEPVGTKDITANGVYNIRTYANVNVQVQPDLGFNDSTNVTFTFINSHNYEVQKPAIQVRELYYYQNQYHIGFFTKTIGFIEANATETGTIEIGSASVENGVKDGFYIEATSEQITDCVNCNVEFTDSNGNTYITFSGNNASFTVTI